MSKGFGELKKPPVGELKCPLASTAAAGERSLCPSEDFKPQCTPRWYRRQTIFRSPHCSDSVFF